MGAGNKRKLLFGLQYFFDQHQQRSIELLFVSLVPFENVTMLTTDMNQKITCIIDDDEIYLFSVKKVIEVNNLSDKVLDFKNGQEALDFFSQYRDDHDALPDVIFLDINMPVMNGWEFIEEFKNIRSTITKDITLYIVSSSVDKTDVDKAKALPTVHDYLTKPITASQLKSIYTAVA